MKRYLLVVEAQKRKWYLQTLSLEALPKGDPREEYGLLAGESLAQYLLRQDMESLVLARGPLPFLAGNKTTVGYRSPLTGVPHYSFVGGRAAAQLLNLGLDAIWLRGPRADVGKRGPYLVIRGRAPSLHVTFVEATNLPLGQRSAFYYLVQRELDGDKQQGSIFAIGTGGHLGYRTANLAADAIFHAGRGGAGAVFARFASALVLRGEPLSAAEFFGDSPFARNPNAILKPLLDRYCARLSGEAGGTIVKMFATGADPKGRNTLPSWNAQRVGHPMADIGGRRILLATRHGHTGCHWCPVDCRHWHWVAADYAPGDKDIFLDDFEPSYAIFSMLGLAPRSDSIEDKLALLAEVNRRLILPIEQMGCDIIDIGVGLAALFEGRQRGLIPVEDLPQRLANAALGDLEAAVAAVDMLQSGQALAHPALRAVGDGPQALVERYPAMADLVFTGGRGTLANAGHANALWTFLMPFSRFFGHYAGQFYKVEETLPPPDAPEEAYAACFRRVVEEMLRREFFGVLCNALSNCAFTFVVYSRDGEGVELAENGLLTQVLSRYGIRATRSELEWFAQAFWAQSMSLKAACGWRPSPASDFPARIYEVLSLTLQRPPEELRRLMDQLIAEWKRQAKAVIEKFGYEAPW